MEVIRAVELTAKDSKAKETAERWHSVQHDVMTHVLCLNHCLVHLFCCIGVDTLQGFVLWVIYEGCVRSNTRLSNMFFIFTFKLLLNCLHAILTV